MPIPSACGFESRAQGRAYEFINTFKHLEKKCKRSKKILYFAAQVVTIHVSAGMTDKPSTLIKGRPSWPSSLLLSARKSARLRPRLVEPATRTVVSPVRASFRCSPLTPAARSTSSVTVIPSSSPPSATVVWTASPPSTSTGTRLLARALRRSPRC